MDPCKPRQDVIEKILLEEVEAQSHNSEYVPSEHSNQEECDYVSTPETDSDGDNVTASDSSDTDGGFEAKSG